MLKQILEAAKQSAKNAPPKTLARIYLVLSIVALSGTIWLLIYAAFDHRSFRFVFVPGIIVGFITARHFWRSFQRLKNGKRNSQTHAN